MTTRTLPHRQDQERQTTSRNTNDQTAKKTRYLVIGLGAGTSLGIAIGVALGNIGAGIGIGMILGVAIGAALDQRNKQNDAWALSQRCRSLVPETASSTNHKRGHPSIRW